MKRLMMGVLSIFLPWIVLLLYDNPGGAIVALVLQATALGWPIASIWAWRVSHSPRKKN